MNWFRLLTAILALSQLLLAQNPESTIVISHVTVIDATGAPPRPDQTVIIRGDRITQISSSRGQLIPAKAHVIEGRGLYLIPGLWDMHVHVWNPDLAFPLFIANGVTAVRNMGGHPDELKHWRQELSTGTRLGPHLFACGPVVDGPPPIHPDHSVVVENATGARSAVDDLKSQGWDFIKVYDNVPRDAYFAIAAEAKKDRIPFVGHVPLSVTAAEASDAGQKSIEHFEGVDYAISPLGDELRRARLERIGKPGQPGEMMKLPLRIANELTQLADTYDEQRASALFAVFKKNGTWQVPTLVVKRAFSSIGDNAFYNDDRLRYVDANTRDEWARTPIVHIDLPAYVEARRRDFQAKLRMARAAHKAGVRFLAGTDSGFPYVYYGASLHDELVLLADAGFTPLEALQAATRDPARFLEDKDSGTIEVGKRADLVLLRADPLADIRNTRSIEAVLLGGRLMERRELDGLLSDVESQAK